MNNSVIIGEHVRLEIYNSYTECELFYDGVPCARINRHVWITHFLPFLMESLILAGVHPHNLYIHLALGEPKP